MKCQIQWIGLDGKPTPDDNEAVAIAHSHKAIWSLPCGGVGNHIVGYSQEIAQSFPHLRGPSAPTAGLDRQRLER